MTPRAKTNWAFSIALVLFAVIGGANWYAMQRLIDANDAVERTREINAALEKLTGLVAAGEGALRGYVITGDTQFLAAHREAVAELPRQLARLVGTAGESAGGDSRGALEPLIAARLALFDTTARLRARPGAPAAAFRALTARGGALTDSLRAGAHRIAATEGQRLANRAERARQSAQTAKAVTILASLVGLLIVVAAMLLVNRDVSARARATAALREAEARTRAVLNTVVDGIITIGEDGIIESVNPAAERLFGWTEGELRGRNVSTLMPEPYASGHDGYLARYLATGEARVVGRTRALTGQRRDGSTFALELAVGEVRLEDRRLFTGIVRDVSERLRLEATVRDTIAMQQAILDSADNSIISTDPDGTIRTFNATAERWLGYSADELVGRATPAILHDPDEVAGRAAELSKAFGTPIAPGFDVFVEEARRGLRSQREWTYVRKDGTRFPVLLSIAPIADADGAIAGFLGIGSDVTARKAAEAARRASEDRYRTVVEVLGEGIFVQDAAGRIVDANASAERILGCARDTFVGKPVGETPWTTLREDGSPMPPEERPASLALRSGQPVRNAVIGAVRPDGTLAWLLVNVQPMGYDRDGRAATAVSSFADITRRKEAEEALRENQERLQDFLDNAHDFILSTAADGRLQYVNRAFEQTLGYRAAEAVGRPVFEFLAEECLDECRASFGRVLAGETVSGIEATFIARDGRQVTVYGSSNCRFEDGRPVSTRSIFRDITEIKRAQEALERSRDEAQRANKAKSDFLANMSHELRTPLNSVIGFAGVLLKNRPGNLVEQDLDFLTRIRDNGTHLLGLINAILDLSKIEAGRVELEIGDTALDRLAEETLALVSGVVRSDAQSTGAVEVVAEVPAGMRPIRADAAKLKQVLINLIGNALRFTERGRVTLRVVADPLTGEADRIEVEDTGIGIPPDRQEAIFEAFQQADSTTARKYGGTGLGLTISRSLLHLMGYRISVASEVGRGSTFSVHMRGSPPNPRPPAAAAAPAAAPAPGAHVPAPAGDGFEQHEFAGRTILAIDDEADSRLLLQQMIAAHGARVVVAASGEEGLHLARTERPDLITVDLMMPGMTGWDVVRALQADPTLQDIPTVVVSIVAEERGGGVRDAEDLLNKPVSRDELLVALRRHLHGSAPAA